VLGEPILVVPDLMCRVSFPFPTHAYAFMSKAVFKIITNAYGHVTLFLKWIYFREILVLRRSSHYQRHITCIFIKRAQKG